MASLCRDDGNSKSGAWVIAGGVLQNEEGLFAALRMTAKRQLRPLSWQFGCYEGGSSLQDELWRIVLRGTQSDCRRSCRSADAVTILSRNCYNLVLRR
jgi:hypothetical protein